MGNCLEVIRSIRFDPPTILVDKYTNTDLLKEDKAVNTTPSLIFVPSKNKMLETKPSKKKGGNVSPISNKSNSNKSFAKSIVKSNLNKEFLPNTNGQPSIDATTFKAGIGVKTNIPKILNLNKTFTDLENKSLSRDSKKGGIEPTYDLFAVQKSSMEHIKAIEYDPMIPIPPISLPQNEDIEITAEISDDFGNIEAEIMGLNSRKELNKKKLAESFKHHTDVEILNDTKIKRDDKLRSGGNMKADGNKQYMIANKIPMTDREILTFTPIDKGRLIDNKASTAKGNLIGVNNVLHGNDKDEEGMFQMEEPSNMISSSHELSSSLPPAHYIIKKSSIRNLPKSDSITMLHTTDPMAAQIINASPSVERFKDPSINYPIGERESEKKKADASFLNRDIDPKIIVTRINSFSLSPSPSAELASPDTLKKNRQSSLDHKPTPQPQNYNKYNEDHILNGVTVKGNKDPSPSPPIPQGSILNPDHYFMDILYVDANKKLRGLNEDSNLSPKE
ncbi:unnamed protein product [Gordionus sp. m RMFG-2023]